MPLDRARILDAALSLAADRHWEAVRLHDLGEELGVGLSQLHGYLAEKEDLVDWFWDRADQEMLSLSEGEAFRALEPAARFEQCVLNWLIVPTRHQRTFREMLWVRMEPGHLHIQLPTLFRVSRSVQWMRECCGRDATFLRRASEEAVLSAVFVATLVRWLNDDSHGAQLTRDWLDGATRRAFQLGNLWPLRSA